MMIHCKHETNLDLRESLIILLFYAWTTQVTMDRL